MLKKSLLAGLVLLSTPLLAHADKIYDEWGYYKGKIDKRGNITDEWGYNKGRIDKDGNLYDEWGRSKGRVTKD